MTTSGRGQQGVSVCLLATWSRLITSLYVWMLATGYVLAWPVCITKLKFRLLLRDFCVFPYFLPPWHLEYQRLTYLMSISAGTCKGGNCVPRFRMILGNCPTWRTNSFQYIYLQFYTCFEHVMLIIRRNRLYQSNKYIERNLCVKLDIYQESLHDAQSTKRFRSYVA